MSVLVNREAPDFCAAAVMGDGSVRPDFRLTDLRGSYIVLFFWPKDFTFVCPTEIIAHQNRLDQFKARNTQIVGVSADNAETHAAWRKTSTASGGIGEVSFPLVADPERSIMRAYGVEHADGVALRASFLIDQAGIVQHQVVNNLNLGRDVDEMLRLIDALQFSEEHGEVCPAGWQKGQDGLKPTREGISIFLAKHAEEL